MPKLDSLRICKILYTICLFSIICFNSISALSHDRDGILTFEVFVEENTFVSISKGPLIVDVHCHRRFDEFGEKRYFEALFSNNGNHVFDLNQHNDGSHSLTLWGWYNTVALKSGDVTAIYHGKPWATRFNMEIASEVIDSIIATGEFEIYQEPNPFRFGGLMMSEELRKKYGFKKNKVFSKRVVKLNNPSDVKKCFKTP